MLDVVEELFQQGVEFHKSGKVEVAHQLSFFNWKLGDRR